MLSRLSLLRLQRRKCFVLLLLAKRENADAWRWLQSTADFVAERRFFCLLRVLLRLSIDELCPAPVRCSRLSSQPLDGIPGTCWQNHAEFLVMSFACSFSFILFFEALLSKILGLLRILSFS